jgi:uncharacterized RDD family membrane protein YckC
METMFPQEPAQFGPAKALFDQHTIETPEQLRLDFAVAGIGSRFLALAVDTLIQIAVLVLVFIALAILGTARVLALRGEPAVWLLALAGVLFFLLFFGYFAIFEILWNGQTPGKRSIGIRVVKDSGRPLTAAESIGRNLLRIVDQLPGFYAIGMAAALLNASNKRLGDLVAGSIVVRESTLAAIRPVWQTTRTQAGPMLGGNALSVEDLTLIDTFLNRRNELTPDVRSRMAARILAQLRPKLPAHTDSGMSTESILESLAWERRSAGGN